MDVKPQLRPQDVGEVVNQEDFPPGMAPKMLHMLKVVDGIEKDLQPLISRPYHEVLNKLPPLERAKIGMMEIYTINSLFWVLMRTSGEDTDATLRDDSKLEMKRLKETQARIAEVEARAQRKHLDVEAAARFIRHGVGANTRNEEMEEITPSSFMAERRKRVEEQENQESSGSSESEEDCGTGEDGARPWYGHGW